MTDTRICTGCGETKLLDEFYDKKNGKYGKHSECKECYKARNKKWSDLNPSQRRRKLDLDILRKDQRREEIKAAQICGIKTYDTLRLEEYKKHCEAHIKRQARLFVNTAIASGLIVKPSRCERCGQETMLHGHHKDYSKPLDVTWVCAKCHHSKELLGG